MVAVYDGSDTLLRKFIYGPGIDESICMIEVDGEKELMSQNVIVRTSLQFIIGVVFAFIVGACIGGFCYFLAIMLPKIKVNLPFLTVSNVGYLLVFLGLPFGSLLGITLIDKMMFKSKGYNVLGITIGFLLSSFGTMITIWILPFFNIDLLGWIMPMGGRIDMILFPFTDTFLCLIGYYGVRAFR